VLRLPQFSAVRCHAAYQTHHAHLDLMANLAVFINEAGDSGPDQVRLRLRVALGFNGAFDILERLLDRAFPVPSLPHSFDLNVDAHSGQRGLYYRLRAWRRAKIQAVRLERRFHKRIVPQLAPAGINAPAAGAAVHGGDILRAARPC
jgi:hypothetical protein